MEHENGFEKRNRGGVECSALQEEDERDKENDHSREARFLCRPLQVT